MCRTIRTIAALSCLLPALAQAQFSTPYDPEGLSTKPTPRERERAASEAASSTSTRRSRPQSYTALNLGPGQKFYDQSFSYSGIDIAPYQGFYEQWLKNFHTARAGRAGFANLDQYDMWFKTIPGGGYEFGALMKNTYIDAMPDNCRREYDELMRQRSGAASSQPRLRLPRGEEDGEGAGCAYLKEREDRSEALNTEMARLKAVRTTKLGSQYIAYVNPGQLVNAGDVFTTTNQGYRFVWRAERITQGGLEFTVIEGAEEESPWTSPYTLYAVIGGAVLVAVLICIFLLKGT